MSHSENGKPQPAQPAARSRRNLKKTAAFAILLTAFATSIYFVEAHAKPLNHLEAVQEGMDQAQVRETLGEPTSIEQVEGCPCWKYTGVMWCSVRVWFTGDGQVERVEHAH